MNKKAFIAALWFAGATAAFAEPCAIRPPPYQFLRFDEDYRYLRDRACRADAWDPVKLIALDGAGERFLTLGGDLRLKHISARRVIVGDDPGDSDNVAAQRFHVHASVQAARALRLFGEIKSNWVANREPGPRPTDVDRLDVHQVFADLRVADTTVRIGRQELLYGAGRRIFPRNGPNVRGSFDAVRVMMQAGAWRADAFAFRPVEIDPGAFDDSAIDTQTFAGIYVTGTPAQTGPLSLDLYWIGARREGVRYGAIVANEGRHSFGVRLAGVRGRWDFDGEATFQNGTFGSQRIRAWAVTADGGLSFAAAHPMRLAVRASAASGDRDPGDARLQTFHSLFPAGGTLDEFFSLSMANTRFVRPSLEVRIAPPLRVRFDVAWTRRQSDRDALYGTGGNVIRASGASRARPVGRDAGVVITWSASRHFSATVLAGRYFPGAFLRETGTADTAWTATTYLSYRF